MPRFAKSLFGQVVIALVLGVLRGALCSGVRRQAQAAG